MRLVLATRPVQLVADYVSPTQPLLESDLTECQNGGFPVLMEGDLNAKHMDRNCRLITDRDSLLRDYAKRNSSLIKGPDSPTTNPYTQNATPDVLDTVVVKVFVLPAHLSVLQSARITCLS
jgi:hypothetical protein